MKNLLSNRRVGTLTLGIVLLGLGILGICRIINPDLISFEEFFHLWPVILILLGIEVILAYIFNKTEKLRYDGWAVVFMVCMLIFAGVMAGGEFFFDYAQDYVEKYGSFYF